jgi:hypothetical protein
MENAVFIVGDVTAQKTQLPPLLRGACFGRCLLPVA